MRSISIFGATGSVGTSTLDLIRRDPDAYSIVALTAHGDVAGLAAAARECRAELAVIGREELYADLKQALQGTGIEAAAGEGALIDAARTGADWTMAALKAGGTVALANKESLVSAGALMMEAAGAAGTTLLPVDSEHNAIFQCLAANRLDDVARIVLTASGGPFRTRSLADMRDITPAQAVAHPNWSMGAKISVDSATMMNKGLELIEAAHLFPVGLDRIEILVHPQSVIHSMVEYRDRSTLAQLGAPDMRIPIASALAWPARIATPCQPLDLARIGRLDFEAPDSERFPALALARAAAEAGGLAPAILNAANEVAVAAFLKGAIGFLDIAMIVEDVLNRYSAPEPACIDDVLAADADARAMAGHVMERLTA